MGVDVPLQGQFLSPKHVLFYTSREEVSTFPCRGSFCHQKSHFSITIGPHKIKKKTPASWASLRRFKFPSKKKSGQSMRFGGFIRLIIRLARLVGLARVPDIRFGVRVRV